MKSPVPDCLVGLRKATRCIHQSVETFTDSHHLLGDAPKRSHYQRFLAAQYLLHQQVARHSACIAAETQNTELLDWPECPRIKALESDLTQQNLAINALSYVDLPYQSHSFTLGLVYVCEGSCIGNQRVLAALNRHACFHQWNSKHYLGTCKQGFSNRWKTLLSSMNQLSTNTSRVDGSGYEEIERGAIAGFDIYKEYWEALSQVSQLQCTQKMLLQ